LIIGSWLTIFVPGIDNDDENWGGNAQPHETQEKGIDGADLLEMLERNIISEGGQVGERTQPAIEKGHLEEIRRMLAGRKGMESMPIKSQQKELQSYVNVTLFHEVKFVESDRLMDLYVMPRVVKHFNLSIEQERPGGTWYETAKRGVKKYLNTKRSNVTVELKKVFVRGK
jgi:hypothetical protein